MKTPHSKPRVTLEMETIANEWLKSQGFRNFAVRGRKLFEDPLRNGTLLLSLIQKLEIDNVEFFL